MGGIVCGCPVMNRLGLNFPPSTNFARIPNIPYPYSGALHDSVLWKQVHPSFYADPLEGIFILSDLGKRTSLPSHIINASNFILGKFISGQINRLFGKFGWVAPSYHEYDFDMIRESLALIYNYALLDFYVSSRDVMVENARLNPGQGRTHQEQLHEVNEQIQALLTEQMRLRTNIKEARARFLTYEMCLPVQLGWKGAFMSWLPAFVGSLLTSAVVYPLYTVGVWYSAQDQKGTWYNTLAQFRDCQRNGTKSLYDGFALQALNVMLRTWLVVPPMMVLKKVIGVPDELSMRYHLNFVLVSLISRDLNLTQVKGEEEKLQMKRSFRAVIKNSVAYTLSDWLVTLGLYPLITVRSRLACQGLPLVPYHYNSTYEAFQTMYHTEGWQSFYNGFYARSLAIIPEMAMWGLIHLAGEFYIEYVWSKEEQHDPLEEKDPSLLDSLHEVNDNEAPQMQKS